MNSQIYGSLNTIPARIEINHFLRREVCSTCLVHIPAEEEKAPRACLIANESRSRYRFESFEFKTFEEQLAESKVWCDSSGMEPALCLNCATRHPCTDAEGKSPLVREESLAHTIFAQEYDLSVDVLRQKGCIKVRPD